MQVTHSEEHIQGSLAHLHQVTAHEAHAQPLNPSQIQPAGSKYVLAERLSTGYCDLAIVPLQLHRTHCARKLIVEVSGAGWSGGKANTTAGKATAKSRECRHCM